MIFLADKLAGCELDARGVIFMSDDLRSRDDDMKNNDATLRINLQRFKHHIYSLCRYPQWPAVNNVVTRCFCWHQKHAIEIRQSRHNKKHDLMFIHNSSDKFRNFETRNRPRHT